MQGGIAADGGDSDVISLSITGLIRLTRETTMLSLHRIGMETSPLLVIILHDPSIR